ncbi:hypothetical protein PENANT_c001G11806 [Penicillium antarcticum]|uniref:RRM domain-containing protein n=1 Tax=Penicillium antarcticum TaxID=416450 RepID=A0A1V6QPQ5_9EURO|nr:uncharacterized protein N7508_010661 [Penicillium antarcticum]KAJ5295840.1 hypothetical protein N7508_010661 [Penicillium antarcticum]OQD90926.1 hypothetical protein PENANT_c001G11806 [Penicillium antarcticum]
MPSQGSQHTNSTGSAQTASTQPAFYKNEPRTPYGPRYPQGNQPSREDSVPALTHRFGNMNLQNNPRSKYGGQRSSAPVSGNPSIDWSNASRAYNSPFILVPNSNMYNGAPGSFVSSGVAGQADQMGQFPYPAAGMYPSMGPVVPGGYSWPYVFNYDIQDVNKQATWNEAQKGAQTENTGQVQYYPSSYVHNMDPAMSGYSYGNMMPQMALPLQMMKTSNGYVVQDLEVLTQQDPSIPRAVPAMWTNPTELTLAKCLENREGITNVYIRGFLPETSDEMLHAYAARFGKIERCKAIVDLDTSYCKGFGFVQYYSFESCENCIRGFFYLGYQASFAQKSRNSRLKDLEDRSSTNIYCTNIPIDWTEADLRRHFEPWRVVSEKISRDEKTGVSKEVGFARFENRDVAEKVLMEFHNVAKDHGVKLLLRFADTKAQKILKQQSNERRAYRAGEYNYSVEVVQGSTPSPSMPHGPLLTPNSQVSLTSPAGVGSNWTPATSISPCHPLMKNPNSSLSSRSLNALDSTPEYRGRGFSKGRRSIADLSAGSSKTVIPVSPDMEPLIYMSPIHKENIRAESMSPMPSRMRTSISPARSCT